MKEGVKCRGYFNDDETPIEEIDEERLLQIQETLVDLNGLGVNPDTITFSGFGSGAYNAHNMHIIYS